MDIIRFAIDNPVKVAVGVILVCLFGVLSIFRIPIQLTPNVDEPKITVTTRWHAASPQEVEREIIERQEEKLKGVTGLRKMTSTCTEGQGQVTLDFFVGIDKDEALRDTIEKINQVSNYPDDVERPEVVAADAALESPIAWIMFRSHKGEDVSMLRDYVWDEVKPILERVPGLAAIDVYGGRERELRVIVDAARLAARGLTFRDLEAALRGENEDSSAGTFTQGRREFTYRTIGQYQSVAQVANTVIANRDGGPVYVRDIAEVTKTFRKQYAFVRSTGDYVLALPARRETGSNVIMVMRGLREQIDKVNREILEPQQRSLELTQVYDETVYITSAINLVRTNLLYGGVLAMAVLLLFLRSARATGVVAISIPISVIATFLFVAMLGRNLNVVMLAGLAFAVGMVVDNAVVVLENIFRHRQMGKDRFKAALEGAGEVWGAVLASTLTTMAVFLPVIFIEEEAGQLFRDIAIAISGAVALSLVVSMFVIPTLSARALGRKVRPAAEGGGRIAGATARLVYWINQSTLRRISLVVVFTALSLVGSALLMPPTDYLPPGNRNLIFGFVITPPGTSIPEFQEMSRSVETVLRPFWQAELDSPEAANLPPVQMAVGGGPGKPGANGAGRMVEVQPPPINNFFFVSFRGRCFMGATSKDEDRAKALIPVLTAAAGKTPGTIPVFFQSNLFGRATGGNSVDLEIRGKDLDTVTAAATQIFAACMQHFGEPPQPDPMNFDLGRPEVQIVPDPVRAAEVGLRTRDIGFILQAAVDGAYVGTFRDQGDEIELRVFIEGTANRSAAGETDTLRYVPLYTPAQAILPLASVVRFDDVNAPQQINRIEEMPAVKFTIRPPSGTPLETVMTDIDEEIVGPLRAQGAIDSSLIISQAGTADKLVQTRNALFGRWHGWSLDSLRSIVESRGFLALLVTYLLMAALFESFSYPLVILLTVPLATVGGFAGLAVVHWLSLFDPVTPIQQFDVVTMLGFVILIGVVVNNAILIVHQALNFMRNEGLERQIAIRESVRTRLRPIFMTALTTIGGQLPLVLMPGAGSELYRGLGAVMVGGLLVATVFTLLLVPAMFSLFVDARAAVFTKIWGPEAAAAKPVALSQASPPPRQP